MERSRIFKVLLAAVGVLVLALLPSACVFASWQVNGNPICTATWDQKYPTITSDGAGGAIITWVEYNGRDSFIYAQRVNASGAVLWTANGVALCTVPGDLQGHPMITSDGAGGAIVTWLDFQRGPYDIYAQRVNASGAVQWMTDGVALCTTTGDQNAAQITSDGAGGAIVTWEDYRGGNWDIYAQRVNASGAVQWMANGVPLCTAVGSQNNPTIVSDSAGGAIVTWQDQRSGNADIYAQRVNASGIVQWTGNGVALCTAPNNQNSPMIASDGAGGATIAWEDNRSGSDYDIYAQRVSAYGVPEYTTNGVAICSAAHYQRYPAIVSDSHSNGGAIIVWQDNRTLADWDVYAQRVDAAGNLLWGTNGESICTAVHDQMALQLTSNGSGGAIITWEDHRSGTNYDIYAQEVSYSGAPQWTVDGMAVCTATGDQTNPAIASDGAGGAIVTWQDYRSGSNYDIYAQRLYPGSCENPSWLEQGNPVSTAPYGQRYPQIIPNSPGGAIIAWQDNRTTADWDIYAQRVDSSGCALWSPDGSAICTSLHDQQNLQLIPDGAGGAIITWEDYRANVNRANIYAQRVNASGYVEWTLEGIPVCVSSNGSKLPRIVSDGAGGAIIAWEKLSLLSSYDVYAQHVNASGVVQWTTNGVPVCAASGGQGFIRMIPDGAGGAIITWDDNRIGSERIYAQRVSASGTVQWAANGIALCAAAYPQMYPQIASDSYGGAIIAWQDYRTEADSSDIYAQRVDATGILKWPSNGVSVCAALGNQSNLQMISDRGSGVIITWEDYRNYNDFNIYTQRVNEWGHLLWDSGPICTAAHYQRYPQITSGWEEGAIIAWQDYRTLADWDIYAQKVDTTLQGTMGKLAWPTNGAPVCTAIHDQATLQLVPDGDGGAIVTWEDYRSGTNYDIYVGRIKHVGTTDVPYAGVTVNALSQNYPNPFNPATLITFSVRAPGDVKLQIYDVQGRSIRTLVDGRRGAGEYRVMWDGKRDDGTAVASGVYFYRLKTGGLAATRKMVLLR